MPGAVALLAVALDEVGTLESPPGSNRQQYGEAYGWNGVAWCAQFAWWCLRQSGNDGLMLKTASVPVLLDWARKQGIADHTPSVGALACYDWGGDGNPDHVGIVLEVTGPHAFDAIEGNTSRDDRGSQSNGGGVFLRHRVTQQVAAFVHLPFAPGGTVSVPTVGQIWGAGMPVTGENLNAQTVLSRIYMEAVRHRDLQDVLDQLAEVKAAIARGTAVFLSAAQIDALGAAVAAHIPPGTAVDPKTLAAALADELAARFARPIT